MSFFKGCKFAVTGDFGGSAPLSKIQSWIAAAGGLYTPTIDDTVTHLVCSQEHYRRNVPSVKEAAQYPRLKIVNFDWLEECLYHRRRTAVRAEHLVAKQIAARCAAKEKRRAARPQKVQDSTHEFIASLAQVSKSVGAPGYQINIDPVGGFAWDALLVKPDGKNSQGDPGRESNRSVRIRLVETLEAPKHYGAYADYRGEGTYFTRVLCSPPRCFQDARKAFEDFFYECAGYDWSRRHLNFEIAPTKWIYMPEKPTAAVLARMQDVVVIADEDDEDDDGKGKAIGSELTVEKNAMSAAVQEPVALEKAEAKETEAELKQVHITAAETQKEAEWMPVRTEEMGFDPQQPLSGSSVQIDSPVAVFCSDQGSTPVSDGHDEPSGYTVEDMIQQAIEERSTDMEALSRNPLQIVIGCDTSEEGVE